MALILKGLMYHQTLYIKDIYTPYRQLFEQILKKNDTKFNFSGANFGTYTFVSLFKLLLTSVKIL